MIFASIQKKNPHCSLDLSAGYISEMAVDFNVNRRAPHTRALRSELKSKTIGLKARDGYVCCSCCVKTTVYVTVPATIVRHVNVTASPVAC